MKKQIFFFAVALSASVSRGQVTAATNNGACTDYVGFGNAMNCTLNINQNYSVTPQPIVFNTGGANGGERMRILDIPFGSPLQSAGGTLCPLPNNTMTRVRINYDAATTPGTFGIVAGALLHLGTDWASNGATGVRDWHTAETQWVSERGGAVRIRFDNNFSTNPALLAPLISFNPFTQYL
jgi:hypothetical protein